MASQRESKKIRVLVADDHPAFREGLARLLADEADLECVATAGDGEEAVRLAAEHSPDVVAMDIAMPKMNGIEATRQIKATRPTTAVLVLSAYSYEPYVYASLQAGAAGYLLKNAPLRELVSAIRAVYVGEALLDPAIAQKVLTRLVSAGGGAKSPRALHERELEVLKLAAKGMSNREIATQLVISERTVQTHFSNIFRKIQVGSRTEAVLHALREGSLTLEDLP